jgi:dTDP-4-dehydrorhamnose reductase
VKILVLGGSGQLGGVIVGRLAAAAHSVAAPSSRDVDLTSAAQLRAAVAEARPEVIINAAAYNFVDRAEEEPLTALAVNAWAPRTLARLATETSAALIHFGTDFVFDGAAATPYTETDAPRPQSKYAISKLCGEWFARECPRHYVLRVESLFGGARHKGSVEYLFDAITNGREARAFTDRVVSPSYVEDVAAATETLIARQAPFGLYHCVNTGAATWFELAQEVARLTGRPPTAVTPVSIADAPLPASRPKYAALSNEKLRAAGIGMPTWQDAIRRFVETRINPGWQLR